MRTGGFLSAGPHLLSEQAYGCARAAYDASRERQTASNILTPSVGTPIASGGLYDVEPNGDCADVQGAAPPMKSTPFRTFPRFVHALSGKRNFNLSERPGGSPPPAKAGTCAY